MAPGSQHDTRQVRRLAAARVVSTGGTEAAQLARICQISAVTHSGVLVAASLFASISTPATP
jgi:hypothetical protein